MESAMPCYVYRRIVSFIVLLVASGVANIFAQQVTMYAVVYPPYSVVDRYSGEVSGLAIDITKAAGEAAGVDVVIEIVPMARIGLAFDRNTNVALIGLKGWIQSGNEETEALDILNLGFVFYYKKTRFPKGLSYKTLEELKPYTIGNVRGSATIDTLEGAGLNLKLLREVSLIFKMLEADRIDLAVGGDITGRLLIQELYPKNTIQLESTSQPFFTTPICIIFKKDDSELPKRFKDGILAIYKNGVYKRILETYCPPGYTVHDLIPQYIHDLEKQ